MKTGNERFFPLTVLRFSIGYGSYLVSKIVFVLAALPLVFVLWPFPRAKYRLLQAVIHHYLAFFSRTWLPAIGVYRVVEIAGRERALTVRPAVCVANHRGFMDSILLLGLMPRTGVLIKSRDTRQPMYGLLARHFDLVSVDRHSLNSVSASLDRCRRVLDAGKNLLIFPEGTRARSGRLQHFNRIAFDLALAAGVPVVPVVIHSTQPFMAKLPGSIFPRRQNDYRIRFLDPEIPHPDDDADALCDRVHRRMAQELNTLDAGTVWETRRVAGDDTAIKEPSATKTP
ncbi:MAG: lysophospholipid acyltransferase family protein [Verrucomicrobiota bacterium]|jgi:1-acyl-sn-glycerol-3-phosphate acyltransferase